MLKDTIIAVSTPWGYGGLGIVRLSGEKALAVAKKIFLPRGKRQKIPPRQPILGCLQDLDGQERYEEAMLTYFPAPKSYTAEDVIEISCHGSPVILEEAVRQGILAGARHAQPGEFTLRAYLNGRIDILQAEAINDIIHAVSLTQAKISFQQMDGRLSRKINKLRDQIIHILSQTEASMEFPDEGLRISPKTIARTLERAVLSVQKLIDSYDVGKTLSEGITIAIAGKTNVGKSTLFNALLDQERAIVTPFPGTTRDYLEESIKIKDAFFTLIDMAGWENTTHPIEKEGIRRGKTLSASADGMLLLFDSSHPLTPEDTALIKKYRQKKIILVFNKIDLPRKMDIVRVQKMAPSLPRIEISALKGTYVEKLKNMLSRLFAKEDEIRDEIILHLRQKLLLEEILSALKKGIQVLQAGFSEEIFIEEIRSALPLMGQLTGEIRADDVLEDIFSRFCIGK